MMINSHYPKTSYSDCREQYYGGSTINNHFKHGSNAIRNYYPNRNGFYMNSDQNNRFSSNEFYVLNNRNISLPMNDDMQSYIASNSYNASYTRKSPSFTNIISRSSSPPSSRSQSPSNMIARSAAEQR